MGPEQRSWIIAVIGLALLGCGSGDMLLQGLDDDDGDDDDGTPGDDDTDDNQPPGAPVVSITPADPTGGDDLICEIVQPALDPDGDDVVYGYAWTVDGSPTNLTTSTVSGDYTEVGDGWTCTVVPSDGVAEGPSASASVTVGQSEFDLVQELSGVTSTDPCPDCEFTFDVTYTTVSQSGSCYLTCDFLFQDGDHTFGYSSAQGMVMVYFSYYQYGGWYGWYYATFDGSRLDFYWNGHGYTQGGYWDVDGGTMTGLAINSEP